MFSEIQLPLKKKTHEELLSRFLYLVDCQADLARTASDHFPELPEAHPEIGILDYWVGILFCFFVLY